MDLTLIKDFFTCQALSQQRRLSKIDQFGRQYPNIGLFSLFKLLSLGFASSLNQKNLCEYFSQHTSNLQLVEPEQIHTQGRAKAFSRKSFCQEQINKKGIRLFLEKWGNAEGQFDFRQFSLFMRGKESDPHPPNEMPYIVKKKFFEILQKEVQALLNIETLRSVCFSYYGNLTDLFQILATRKTNQIDRKAIQNLYLMHSQRMEEPFLVNLQKRLTLPLNFERFSKILKRDTKQSLRQPQNKIFYSSARRKKDPYNDFIEENEADKHKQQPSIFKSPQPPRKHLKGTRYATSTRAVKQTYNKDLSYLSASRFSLSAKSQKQAWAETAKIQILGEILSMQEQFNEFKRKITYRPDFDLELLYQREGAKFQSVLNKAYGLCNFSAFVRFIVPQDFEHRYLAFLKYEKTNKLTEQTQELVSELLEQYERKEENIQCLWDKIDRETIFRMYCNPCDETISCQQLEKYFTQRECKILLDRMDPFRTGQITYENFH